MSGKQEPWGGKEHRRIFLMELEPLIFSLNAQDEKENLNPQEASLLNSHINGMLTIIG